MFEVWGSSYFPDRLQRPFRTATVEEYSFPGGEKRRKSSGDDCNRSLFFWPPFRTVTRASFQSTECPRLVQRSENKLMWLRHAFLHFSGLEFELSWKWWSDERKDDATAARAAAEWRSEPKVSLCSSGHVSRLTELSILSIFPLFRETSTTS